MLHLYVQDLIQGDTFILTDKEQLHHLTVVSRARHGDAISLFDRQGNAYLGSISLIKKTELTVQIASRLKAKLSKIQLTLACAIPKASGMDDIVDRLTQLGVTTLIPMMTERVLAKTFEPQKKLDRWRKIALNAAEQSQRNSLLEIPGVLGLDEVMQMTANFDLKLIPTLYGRTKSLTEVLQKLSSGKIVVLIGPEGDFTSQEVEKAQLEGFIPVSLGRNVLRVDTAAVAVAALVQLNFQES
jgi:16S rRNA (uracil1498-N3)-methyltransferase